MYFLVFPNSSCLVSVKKLIFAFLIFCGIVSIVKPLQYRIEDDEEHEDFPRLFFIDLTFDWRLDVEILIL